MHNRYCRTIGNQVFPIFGNPFSASILKHSVTKSNQVEAVNNLNQTMRHHIHLIMHGGNWSLYNQIQLKRFIVCVYSGGVGITSQQYSYLTLSDSRVLWYQPYPLINQESNCTITNGDSTRWKEHFLTPIEQYRLRHVYSQPHSGHVLAANSSPALSPNLALAEPIF